MSISNSTLLNTASKSIFGGQVIYSSQVVQIVIHRHFSTLQVVINRWLYLKMSVSGLPNKVGVEGTCMLFEAFSLTKAFLQEIQYTCVSFIKRVRIRSS